MRTAVIAVCSFFLGLASLTACGSSDSEQDNNEGSVSLEGAASALERRFGPKEAMAATIRSLDRGYSYEQIIAAGAAGRLEQDGTIADKPGGDTKESPASAPTGRFTRAAGGAAMVARVPATGDLGRVSTRAAEDLDRLMLMLEIIADQMKDTAGETRPPKPEDYSGLVVLLELARIGYSASEIFLVLADDRIGKEGRFRRLPASDGFAIVVLNEDGSYQCPEGAGGEFCSRLEEKRAADSKLLTPTAAAQVATPEATPTAGGKCHRGKLALPPDIEAQGFFLGYAKSPTIELCLPETSGPLTGRFELIYRGDMEALYRGSPLALKGPCTMQISLTGQLSGTGAWNGTAFSAEATINVTGAETVIAGCATEKADTEAETWVGPLRLTGTTGTLGTGEGNVDLHISELKR